MSELTKNNPPYRSLWTAAILLLIVWCSFSYIGLFSAVEIWYGNEIFNHGFLIVPGAIYFAYLKRFEWSTKPIHSTFWAFPFLLAGIGLYVIGYAGDIQLFMHAAAFGLIPVLAWMLMGHKAVWTLVFPLCFLVFAIPVGEQLIPWLQEVTADISVYMLKLTGIPLYRSGLYIEIPQGKFLVAEACSGISFFIASMVVGVVYSFLNFNSAKKRVFFFILSVIYPIIANAIRVYGIIYIGYRSNMTHAVGADHLIYGWFFFAFVLISLLGIGELIRDKNMNWSASENDSSTAPKIVPKVFVSKWIVGVATASFLSAIVWMSWINTQQNNSAQESATFLAMPNDFHITTINGAKDYHPELKNVSERLVGLRRVESGKPDVIYQAWFNGKSGELVSGLHRLYSEKAWSLVSQQSMKLKSGKSLQVKEISDPSGHKRLLAYWYVVDGNIFTDDTPTKLYQTAHALVGGGKAGLRIIVSVSMNMSNTQNAKLEAFSRLDKITEELMRKDIH